MFDFAAKRLHRKILKGEKIGTFVGGKMPTDELLLNGDRKNGKSDS